jgi:hypothetical protein
LALIEDNKLPDALKQYTPRLQSLYNPPLRRPRRPSNSKFSPLSENILNLLVDYLNDTEKKNCIWLRPDKWASLSKSESIGYSPVPARAQFYKQFEYNDGLVSTFTQNPDNCCIYFKSVKGDNCFGRIFSIFSHSRASAPNCITTDIWLNVQCFPCLPHAQYKFNPFDSADHAEVQCALRMWSSTETKIIKLNEVIAQCTWIMYKPGEMNQHINVPTIGMIILER